MKLFVTGGHLTPAIATIDELLSRKNHPEIVFIGRTTAMEGTRLDSYEKSEMDSRNIRFLPLITGRLQRFVSLYTVLSLIKIPIGFFQSLYFCITYRPDCILSFGGYIGLPVSMAGALLGIPVIIHEQTLRPGLANRIISKVAKKICITFEETRSVFPAEKVLYTGLPIRNQFFKENLSNTVFNNPNHLPVIYITGGSTGSVSINSLIFPHLANLTTTSIVVHQTGSLGYEDAMRAKEKIPPDQRERYIAREYLAGNEIGAVMNEASLVIGRSGANTVMELAILAKVAILIPLPWSANNEQIYNAKWLASNGGAIMLSQEGLQSQILLQEITRMMSSDDYIQKAKSFAGRIPRNGALILSNAVEHLMRSLT